MGEERNPRWRWHDAEEILEKLNQADKELRRGLGVMEAAKAIGVSYATYRRWKAHYGGMSLQQLRRTRNLEVENNRMRQLIAKLDAPYSLEIERFERDLVA